MENTCPTDSTIKLDFSYCPPDIDFGQLKTIFIDKEMRAFDKDGNYLGDVVQNKDSEYEITKPVFYEV